jgi:uncharacterized membrane protein (DUF441 family)
MTSLILHTPYLCPNPNKFVVTVTANTRNKIFPLVNSESIQSQIILLGFAAVMKPRAAAIDPFIPLTFSFVKTFDMILAIPPRTTMNRNDKK